MTERTSLSREMYERLISALLDGDEDQRIATATELSKDVPSWWNGPTRHQELAHTRRDEAAS